MPRFSKPVVVDGQVIGIACGRIPHKKCSTPGCRNHAGRLCDYPVNRGGNRGTCDRAICDGCSVRAGSGLDHCPPHARLAASAKEKPGA